MYGTLRRALAVRGVEVAPEDYVATVEGRRPSQLKPSRTGSISSSPSYRRRREPRGDGRQQPVSGYTVQMDNEDLDLDASIRPGTGSYLGQGTDGTASGPPHWPTRKRQAHCTEFQPPPQTTWS